MVPTIYDNGDLKESDNAEGGNSPKSLDHQLSMTERQISMVEQQLNMIQQVQNQSMGSQQPAPLAHMHPQALFHPAGPNPMIFDMPPHMFAGHPLLDPNSVQQMPMFANSSQQLLNQPPPMMPMNPAGLDPNMNGNSMANFRY